MSRRRHRTPPHGCRYVFRSVEYRRHVRRSRRRAGRQPGRQRLQPDLRPAGVAARTRAGIRAHLLGRHGRTAGGRRADPGRHRGRRGHRRLGFTGLSAARWRATTACGRWCWRPIAVWGCTSRNGGQGQNASGRLYRSQWIERWGLETARRLDAEIHEGFDYWKSLVAQIDCDAQPGGHLYTAHREKKMDFLRNEARVMREQFGYDTRMLTRDELRERYVDDHEAMGALLEPDGIGVHPLKLAYGYMRQARALGVRLHPGSPVLGWTEEGGGYRLQTPGGTVRARRVAFATGGYTAQGVNRLLDNRIMPILSNSMVTRALTPDERARPA
ncbi:FAD-dependent oxidoreductase [Achromobacter insuavis]